MDVEIDIAQGRLRGRHADGVSRFCAIPFAAPPYGELRFQAPAPAPAWSGVHDGTDFGPTALKPRQPDVFEELLPDPEIGGEDCLTVNVWTPDGAAGLPVLVWVHGGGYLTGSGAVPIYDGASFAHHGVVCVTINYRLGVDGFALLPGAPANRGLLDVIAALGWVQANIDRFGGDPTRVTLAGQSAGAMAVTSVLTMPAARSLFRRVIAQSGAGHHALSRSTAEHVVTALCAELGVLATVEGLASVGNERLLSAVQDLVARIPTDPDPGWDEVRQKAMAFQPVVDAETLPAVPIEALRAGVGSDVGLLIGTNSDEFTLWSVPTGLAETLDDTALDGLLAGLEVEVAATRAAYAAARPAGSPAQLYADVMTDWSFRVPAIRAAEARADARCATYCYEFTWPSPLFDGRLGATHASEVAFGFDNLAVDWARALRGDAAPQAVADDMHGALVAFVRDGAPGWAQYGADRNVRLFGEEPRVVADPGAGRRSAWEGVR